jgi:DNA-binding CsgD family transcriptional regulator
MTSANTVPHLLGRRAECDALDALLADALTGRSQVIVLRGEAGIGKSALLDYVSWRATGWRVARAVGVESEMELAFSSLQQLCASMTERLGALPGPQRDALTTVLGMSSGPAPDPFLVGLATLTVFAAVSEEQPLLCVIDDAQWLDQASAQVLGFVARRLQAEQIAFVGAARIGVGDGVLSGLPELRVEGLAESDARALLLDSVHSPLDPAVCDQLVVESRGNPLALLELPRTWTSASLAGGFGFPDSLLVPGKIEQSYLRRLAQLPPDTRLLVIAMAAEPLGDVELFQRAAESLGVDALAIEPALDAGLAKLGRRAEFVHPLVRSAAYRSASRSDRLRVHRALAEATDARTDPDRRAWHRAQATSGSDDEVAAELEQSADRAQSRGGVAAAAAFMRRSAALTVDSTRRDERTLAAAQASLAAGDFSEARMTLTNLEARTVDEGRRARCDLLRGLIAFASGNSREAPPLLLRAAIRLESGDPALARDTYLEALVAALFVGRLAGDVGVVEVAQAARAAPPVGQRPSDLLLDGFTTLITDGHEAGAPVMKRAVGEFRRDDLPLSDGIRWLWHATHAAHDVWDDESWEVLCTRHVRLARQVGALAVLPLALSARIGLHLFAGELDQAASLVDEVDSVGEATGNRLPPYGALALAAWQGREIEASSMIDAARTDLVPRGEGMGLTLVDHAAAVLYNGLGRYEDACEAAQHGASHPQELAFSTWSLVQLVEAAARSDQPARARDALERLARTTGPSGTHWARGIEARSRALVSDGETAEEQYRGAIEHLSRTRLRGELARAHLIYGEWLRREGRRVDARDQLRIAHDMLTEFGMQAFCERAGRELLATGEKVRKRTDETRGDLTPQERQIARLARDGLSNPEIGSMLFLSPRTVEWHLHNVFTKLGISSRAKLREALPESPSLATV